MFNNKDRKEQIFSERGVFRCFKGHERKKFRDKPPSSVPATPLWAVRGVELQKRWGQRSCLQTMRKENKSQA